MKTKKGSLIMLIMLLMTVQVLMAQCEGNQIVLDAIKEKYELKYKNIEKDAKEIEEEAPDPDNPIETSAKVDFDIEMKEQHFALDLVSVTMRDKKISLDLPQITMKLKSIKFDKVYTKMVLKKTGQYPQIHCKDTWIKILGGKTKGVPKCKTVWKDILTKIPEVHTKTVEVKTKLPQFKMDRTEFVLGVPEFKMLRQDIKMNLPSVIVKDVSVQTRNMEKKTENLQNYSQDLVGEQKKEFAEAISNNYSCHRESLVQKREELTDGFSKSIKEIDLNIEQLKDNGLNPSNLKSAEGETINLVALKYDLTIKEKEALETIDKAIENLNSSEKETIKKYFTE